MRLLFNFLRRPVQVRNAFFILFCLFGSTGAFAQVIIPPPIPIIKATSTTTITSSVNPSLAGQPVLLTATITGSAQPTGTVHFYDNTTNTDLTPAGVAISNGKAIFTTAVLTVNASFIATYSGDGGNLPSTSAAFTQTVNPPVIIINIDPAFYPTTTTLVSNSNPSVAGSEPVTFTATVSSSGNVNVTGIVDFLDNTNSQNLTPGGIPVIDGIATFTTSSLPFGDLNITAVYRGDANGNQQSISNILIQRVQLNITGMAITLTSSTGGTSNWGTKVTFTATVSTGIGAPSGIVMFTDNGYLLGYVPMDASGKATLATRLLTPGSHSITASYFSISSVLTQNVTPGYPTIFVGQGTGNNHSNVGIIGSTLLENYGQPITFAVNVLGDGINIPTGNVSFIDGIDPQNLINLGTIGLDEAGNGFFTTSILPVGSHLIYAVYSGNDIYLEDSSNASSDNNTKGNKFNDVDVLVRRTSTTTSISSSRNPSVAGQQITFTATVSFPSPGSNAIAPGGTVIFNIDGIDQDPAPLSGNGVKAFLDISSLSIGNHTVKATYLGDENYIESSSGSIVQVVERVGSGLFYFLDDSQTTPVNTVFPNPLMFNILDFNPRLVDGASVTFTAPSSGASGTFSNGTNSITTNTTRLGSVGAANSGSFTANGIAGTYTVTATIPGFGTGSFTMTNTALPGACDPEALAFTGSYTDVSLGLNPANPDGSLGTATATDANGAVAVTSTDGPVVSDGCNRSRTRTFTATDGCLNTSTTSRTVRWIEDMVAPTVTKGSIAPCYKTVADAENAAKNATTYSDNCSTNDQLVVSAQTVGTCSATITMTVTDAANNSNSVSYTTKIDNAAPILSSYPENMNLNCTTPIFPLPVTASDNCDGIVNVIFNETNTRGGDPAQSSYFNYTVTRTWSASDACGNTVAHTQTITVEDKTPPELNCPGSMTVSTEAGLCYADVTFNVNASELCGLVDTRYYLYYGTGEEEPVGPQWRFDAGSYTVTVVSTDVSGNSSSCTIALTVSDTDKPTVVTKNIIVQMNATGNATISNNEVNDGSSDNCTPQANLIFETNIKSFSCSDIGSPVTVTLKVTDASGNTAMAAATVTVVDNTPPTVNTKNATIYLNASGQATLTVEQVNNNSTDNCSIPLNGYMLSKTSFDCSNVGANTVTLKVTDVNGNTATATAAVTVVDNIPPTVNTKNATIYLNASGQATLTVAQVDNNSTDNCSIPSDGYMLSKTSFDCSIAGPNSVTLKVTDANGNTATATATVTVVDNIPPTANPKNATVYLNASGQATLIVEQVNNNSTDNCSIASNGYMLSTTSFDCSNVGPNSVTLKVTDANGNTATATAAVTVVDNTPPTVNTKNATIYLNASGQATLTVGQVNDNSTDNCSIPLNGFMLSKTSFDCSNAGPNTVTLKVTDVNGNTATATAAVTVVDNIPPTVNTKNATIYLNASGQATLTVAQVNNNSTDNCSIPSDGSMLSKTSFDCSNAGPNSVTLKVTDANGNTATATATVTVVDNIPPTANTKNATIYLNASGQATLTVEQVNNNSTDNCLIPSNGYMLSKTSFDCSNVGPNTVTLKVTDASGNTATATATVTVVDNIPPTVNTQNVTIYLNAAGQSSVTAVQVNNNSTDNCSIPSNGYQLSKTSFDCSNAGPNTVTLKVTDVNGNTATATAIVTVVDNTPPVIHNASPAICVLSPANHKMRDVTINYSLTDNCGTISSVLSVSSDEPIYGTGDGDSGPDWEVIDNHNVKLRAERSGSGDGRVYTITIKATDASGNTSTASVEVRVTHNITSPKSGQSFKVGSTVNLEGEFWDKLGSKHTATWLIDDNTTVKGTVTEPTVTKNGKVTGSYKFTAPGVYKLQMNTKDQNNVVSYANTSGDLEAIIVIYDPNGGYTYGGGYFNSPAGAVTSNLSATGKGSYGFSVNYFKGATYPKGETQFEFKVGEFEFNALNFEYMSIAGARAQMKGTGKIIGGQSGINFILTVTDGQLDGTGIDKIRMKIYNKNTMEVYYDNQPGAGDALNPTTPVQESSTVVISGTNVSNLTQSNQVTTKMEQESTPFADDLTVKAMPNPSKTNFRIVISSKNLEEPVKLVVSDMLGRVIETRITTAGQIITVGDRYRSGTYAVRIIQGKKIRQLKLIKIPD